MNERMGGKNDVIERTRPRRICMGKTEEVPDCGTTSQSSNNSYYCLRWRGGKGDGWNYEILVHVNERQGEKKTYKTAKLNERKKNRKKQKQHSEMKTR